MTTTVAMFEGAYAAVRDRLNRLDLDINIITFDTEPDIGMKIIPFSRTSA